MLLQRLFYNIRSMLLMNFYSNYFFVTFSLTEFDLYVEIGDELFKFEREKIALLIRLT